jgi:hypothetical protein
VQCGLATFRIRFAGRKEAMAVKILAELVEVVVAGIC